MNVLGARQEPGIDYFPLQQTKHPWRLNVPAHIDVFENHDQTCPINADGGHGKLEVSGVVDHSTVNDTQYAEKLKWVFNGGDCFDLLYKFFDCRRRCGNLVAAVTFDMFKRFFSCCSCVFHVSG